MHQKRPRVGVGVMVLKDGKVLLGKRQNAHGAGTWQFPGGHLEFGETPADCAVREVAEETGLTIRNIRIGPYTNDLFLEEGKHYITLYIIADHHSGQPVVKEPEKCERWEWFDWSDLPRPRFLPLANLLKQNLFDNGTPLP